MVYDVAIVGGGVVGALIAKELSKYEINTVLLEKCNDVAQGTTKANSAIVHAGYDAIPGTLKAELNAEGSRVMCSLCIDLSVPYKNIGSLVVAFSDEEIKTLEELYERGRKNHIPQVEIIGAERLFELEPNINRDAVGALYAPTAAIISPFELCTAAVENAFTNGVDYIRNFEVAEIETDENGDFVLKSDSSRVTAKYVINAAGVFADKIAQMIGDDSMEITPRKGEYFLFDKCVGTVVSHIIFQCPTEMGKGVLITPTVHENLLIGPSAVDIEDKEDLSTTSWGTNYVQSQVAKTLPDFAVRDVITTFAGLRARADSEDFIIQKSIKNNKFINVAGIDSPGLSAAPAIAKYVENILLSEMGELKKKEDYNPLRENPVRFNEMTRAQRKAIIEKDKAYGRIVCRCETVTEGEIIDAIHAPAGARDVDGVKRRTRAGMGRCQGGFCGSKVVEILARELNTSLDEITKFGGDSNYVIGKTK
ncbi:MAG TPA: NAD(P)/FAD-dependent oxidoreductase [Clostridia bacterium]|nr:NAD(P)/FAD-dependent oxidoreductase [Clostridia bacterium]